MGNNKKIAENVLLEVKSQIQPFEKVLSLMELSGLINDPNILTRNLSNNILSINTETEIEILSKRLAYWQRIGRPNLHPTLQIALENCDGNGKNNLDISTIQSDLLVWNANKGRSDSNKINAALKIPKRRILRYGPHDLHEYRGKFFPQMVKSLINFSSLADGAIVLDPMCGSGTTTCEARAMGMVALGLDYNPLSYEISRIKTGIVDIKPDVLEKEWAKLKKKVIENSKLSMDIEDRWNLDDLHYLKNWFDFQAIIEINTLLIIIEEGDDPFIVDFFKLCLSNLIREISWQKISDLRVRKEISDYKEGQVFSRFIDVVEKQIAKIIPYIKIIKKNIVLEKYMIKCGDVRNLDEEFADFYQKCDCLITSPPYAMALPYLDTDRLSLIILGLLSRKEHRKADLQMVGNREISEKQRQEIWTNYLNHRDRLPIAVCELIEDISEVYHTDNVGFRRRNLPALLAKYFLDMSEIMNKSRNLLKPGSYGCFIVGNNSTFINEKQKVIPTNQFLWDIGEMAGWEQSKYIDMELLPSRDIFRENRGTAESILIFKA